MDTVSKLVVHNASTCDENEKLKFFSKNIETKSQAEESPWMLDHEEVGNCRSICFDCPSNTVLLYDLLCCAIIEREGMYEGGVGYLSSLGPQLPWEENIETKLGAHHSCAGEARAFVRSQPWQRRSEYRVYKQNFLVDLCPRRLAK